MEQRSPGVLSAEAFQALFDECSNWGRWGAEDERGTLNLITPEHRVRAAGLVRDGQTVSCAWPINTQADVDNIFPATHLMMRAGDVAEEWPTRSVADYLALAPHGVSHSHLDALCHLTWQNRIYNNRPTSVVTSMGALANSITIGQDGILSRGVLLDLPASQGVEWLEPGSTALPEELEAAELAAGLRLAEGDILLVRTGRQRRRVVEGPWDSRALLAGLHPQCGPWLRQRGVALLGCDGVNDAHPSVVEGVGLPLHTLTLVAMGMQLLDNLSLEDLAEACSSHGRWEFLLAIAPLRLERGTASAVNPIAVF